jgi:C-terminal processing protease CtpA/Prc
MCGYMLAVTHPALFAQPSVQTASDSTYFRRLEYVCKVWGYVKYFHPNMVRENAWDDVLIEAITSVKASTTQSAYNGAIEKLVNSAGAVRFTLLPAPNLVPERLLPVDYSWMTNATMLSQSARNSLQAIRQGFRPFQSYFVNTSRVSTPQAVNERTYSTMTTPNEQYRLLALFRYWNLINYFYPYKDDIGRPWDEALREMIPLFVNIPDNTRDYVFALHRMSAQINDSHGSLSNPLHLQSWGDGTFPMALRHIEGRTVVSAINFTPALMNMAGLANLRVGDIITTMNSIPIDTLRKQLTPLIPASNISSLNRDLNTFLLFGNIGDAPITIQRDTQSITLPARRVSFSALNAGRITPSLPTVWRILDNNIGYVNMGRLQSAEIPTMIRDLENTRGIIFDVRNYPNFILYELCSYLGPSTPFVKFTRPDPFHPGTFAAPSQAFVSPPFSSVSNVGSSKRYKGIMVALMNETTQSRAEFTLMAFKAMGMRLVGSQTAGTDGDVLTVPMPGNVVINYTSLGVFYPDGTKTQRIGIVPDIRVLPTLAGYLAGRDEVLERGIQVITGTTSVASQTNFPEQAVQIAPNPCSDEARISFTSYQFGKASVKITNVLGVMVMSKEINVQSGENTLTLSTSELPNGAYICRVHVPNMASNLIRSFVVAR